MTESLVAINILDKTNNKLLNPTLVPLLFYWNGEDDVLTEIRHNEDFIKFIEQHITELNYTQTDIAFFYFTNISGVEDYKDKNISIQEAISLNLFNSENIVNYFIKLHFEELYKISFKTDFDNTDINIVDEIKQIYKVLKDKFSSRISKPTVVNWVRSVLLDKDNFNNTNTTYIINKLNEILKDYD